MNAPRSRAFSARSALFVLFAVLATAFTALGVWQLHRREWKLALIEQVEQRLAAAPIPAPAPRSWSTIGPQDAYRRVVVTGEYLPDIAVPVQAVTDLGAGYWILSPLRTHGALVFVNRGFVAAEQASRVAPPAGMQRVSGLLRLPEPGGGFLRSNRPDEDRWYSRDIAAIAQRQGLKSVAPYFIDADRDARSAPDAPVGGLTVVRFHNSHLIYAITWFALGLMSVGMTIRLVKQPMSRGP